jgi:hypothetical protein
MIFNINGINANVPSRNTVINNVNEAIDFFSKSWNVTMKFDFNNDATHIILESNYMNCNGAKIVLLTSEKVLQGITDAMTGNLETLRSMTEKKDYGELCQGDVRQDIFSIFLLSEAKGEFLSDFIGSNGVHYARVNFTLAKYRNVFFCLKRNLGLESLLRATQCPYNKDVFNSFSEETVDD